MQMTHISTSPLLRFQTQWERCCPAEAVHRTEDSDHTDHSESCRSASFFCRKTALQSWTHSVYKKKHYDLINMKLWIDL